MPLVIADVFSRFPVGDFVIQVNNRKIPNGFYQGIGLSDVTSTLRIADKLDKLGAEKVADLLVESGATREQAEQCLALEPLFARRIEVRERVRELGVTHPLLEEGSSHWRRSSAPRWPTRRARSSLTCASLVARLLHGHRLRDPDHRQRGLGLGLPRRQAMTPSPSDGRNTYPGVESRSACPASSGCSSDRASSRRLARPLPRSWWP